MTGRHPATAAQRTELLHRMLLLRRGEDAGRGDEAMTVGLSCALGPADTLVPASRPGGPAWAVELAQDDVLQHRPAVVVRRSSAGLRGRSGSLCPFLGEGEQAGLGLGQDLAVDQAFQLGADAFGVLGSVPMPRARQTSLARRPRRSGEHGEDLLVGLADDGRFGEATSSWWILVRVWRVVARSASSLSMAASSAASLVICSRSWSRAALVAASRAAIRSRMVAVFTPGPARTVCGAGQPADEVRRRGPQCARHRRLRAGSRTPGPGGGAASTCR